MKFPKDDLFEVMCDVEFEGYKLVYDKVYETGRWSIFHEMVFGVTRGSGITRYFRSYYSVGATEAQDEQAWMYEGDMIECDEVQRVEKMVVVYE